jgi:DNA-binding PadR family transcriptional regulator
VTLENSKGAKLEVFSGKKARLNRVILKTLEKKGALIPYDTWLLIKGIKGFRHAKHKTVCRRMQALERQRWITPKGTRPTKPSGDSTLYELTLKGKAALKLEEKSVDTFLQTAKDEQLQLLIAALS